MSITDSDSDWSQSTNSSSEEVPHQEIESPSLSSPESYSDGSSSPEPPILGDRLARLEQQFQASQAVSARIMEEIKRATSVQRSLGRRQNNHERRRRHRAPARKPSGPIPEDIRNQIREGFSNGESARDLHERFHVSIGSVYNIVHENENSDDAPPAKRCRSGPKSVFDDEATAVLVLEMIEDRSELTLAQIIDELRTEHEIETSTSSLQRFLKDCCIMWKNMYKIPPHWNTPELLAARADYVRDLSLQCVYRHLLWVDETGFQISTLSRSRGRAPAGQVAVISPQPKRSRINVIAAMDNTGILLTKRIRCTTARTNNGKGGVNGEDFRGFLLDLAQTVEGPALLILDNARIHHAVLLEPTWRILSEHYNIDHLYLPPYSPFLNPIELLFNAVKANMKGERYDGIPHLERSIDEYFQDVPAADCLRFIEHSKGFYQACLARSAFRGPLLNPAHD